MPRKEGGEGSQAAVPTAAQDRLLPASWKPAKSLCRKKNTMRRRPLIQPRRKPNTPFPHPSPVARRTPSPRGSVVVWHPHTAAPVHPHPIHPVSPCSIPRRHRIGTMVSPPYVWLKRDSMGQVNGELSEYLTARSTGARHVLNAMRLIPFSPAAPCTPCPSPDPLAG
jgi:hypothetical protein